MDFSNAIMVDQGQASGDSEINCVVPANYYFPTLSDNNLAFKFTAVAYYVDDDGIHEGSHYQSAHTFQLSIPKDMISVTNFIAGEGYYTVEGVFKNTAGFELTNVVARVQPETAEAQSVHLDNVDAGAEQSFSIDIQFRRPGQRRFSVAIDTDEVPDIISNFQEIIEPDHVYAHY